MVFFRNLLVDKFKNYGYQFQFLLGVLCFKPIHKYCYVWYKGISCISQWSDTEPSWPSCFKFQTFQLAYISVLTCILLVNTLEFRTLMGKKILGLLILYLKKYCMDQIRVIFYSFTAYIPFYAPVSKDRGHIVLPLSVCPSVCVCTNLT